MPDPYTSSGHGEKGTRSLRVNFEGKPCNKQDLAVEVCELAGHCDAHEMQFANGKSLGRRCFDTMSWVALYKGKPQLHHHPFEDIKSYLEKHISCFPCKTPDICSSFIPTLCYRNEPRAPNGAAPKIT